MKLTKLSTEQEAQLPNEIQALRKFYFENLESISLDLQNLPPIKGRSRTK